MALFDTQDTFLGLSDAKFTDRIDKMSIKERETLYLKAKDEYYKGSPVMSDHQFDMLEDGLKKIGSKVINQVGGADAAMGKLIHKHLTPMLSLDKIQVNDEDNFPLNEILGWFPISGFPYEATPKYDGNAIELQYADGKLIKAVTRGKNGKGAECTSKMRLMVPEIIKSKLTLEIRGEVVMPVDVFNTKYLKDVGTVDGRYANPRNMIGGILNPDNDLNAVLEKVNDCFFVAYSAKVVETTGFRYVDDTMENLKKLGFNDKYQVPVRIINSSADVRTAYEWFKQYRATGTFQLDGIVLKMPEDKRLSVGENNHHPKWAVAVKFPSKTASTKIIDTEWTVGPTGELSPVGLLEPVDLDGSMVGRVSLYNKTKMEQGGLFPGALVTIKKSGDIIPQIIKVDLPSPDTAKYIKEQNFYPTECPSCKSVLVIQKDHSTEHIMCLNHKCPAQNARKLAKGLAALGIKGIGESTCIDLFDSGVEDIFDFFDENKLNEAFLCSGSAIFKPGRQLDIILSLPSKLKQVELDRMILSLQIEGVGNTVSKQVARMFAGIGYSFDGLELAVVDPFKNPNSPQTLLVKKLKSILEDRGVVIDMPKDIVGAITYEMTGSPKGTGYDTKEEVIAFLATKGYAHTKLKEAKILLTDSYSSSSTKMKDAAKRGIKILTYEDLINSI